MPNRALPYIGGFLYDLGLKLIPLVLMSLLTLASFWFLQKNTTEEPIPTTRIKKHQPDYVFTQAKLTVLNVDGSTKYKLMGKEFKHYEDDASIDIVLPRMRLFNPQSPPLTVSSNTAHITGDLDILELFQQADISRPAQMNDSGQEINPALHLESNYLKFLVNDDLMKTHLPIKIQRGDSVMNSTDGATYDNVNHAATMFGNVQGSIAPNATLKTTPLKTIAP